MLDKLQQTTTPYKPAWWLNSGHMQTVWASTMRVLDNQPIQRALHELPDGEILDIYWQGDPDKQAAVILLPGIGANVNSPYMRSMMNSLHTNGFAVACFHYRGAGLMASQVGKVYHGGLSEDFDHWMQAFMTQYPQQRPIVVGLSIGGNMLLKWLGEQGDRAPVHLAVAVNPPFDLQKVSHHLTYEASPVYQDGLLTSCIDVVRHNVLGGPFEVDMDKLMASKTFVSYDEMVTVPMYGFADANEYYQTASCGQWLKKITRPTMVIQDEWDPVMPPNQAITEDDLPPSVMLMQTKGGGHLGYVQGQPNHPSYWLEDTLAAWAKMAVEQF